MTKKASVLFEVVRNEHLSNMYSQLLLREIGQADSGCGSVDGIMHRNVVDYEVIKPGQFVEVLITGSKSTFLRRPISINWVNPEHHEIQLLVCRAGDGTNALCDMKVGETVDMVLPLGNGFSVAKSGKKPLLIGGGVGVAPLLYLGKALKDKGISPTFLLAARSGANLLQLDAFRQLGDVLIATDDGSMGHKGLVTSHPELGNGVWDMIYCCGPMPMMKAVGRIAREHDMPCEVSLENSMACGLGACLCCVEDTVNGHVCVCTDGPVFSIADLKWFD